MFANKFIIPREVIKPEFINEKVFDSILDGSVTASANYFTLSGSTSAESKVEVVVENVFRAGGAPFSTPRIKAAANALVREHFKPNRRYFYIQHMLYTTVKHKNFSQVEGNAKFAGVGFGSGGQVYASTQGFSLEKVVSVNVLELSTGLEPVTLAVSPSFAGRRPASDGRSAPSDRPLDGDAITPPINLRLKPNRRIRPVQKIQSLRKVSS